MFFCALCYGGCAWGTFGCAGFPRFRSVNPRTAATQSCLTAGGGSAFTTWSYILKKIISNPAGASNARKIFLVGTDVGTEEALANASEILSSALQTAYQCAEDPDSTQSPVIMGLAQLIESAQALVDAVLERQFPTDKSVKS